MDTLCTFGDNIIKHYETKTVHFLGLMNSATKNCKVSGFRTGVSRQGIEGLSGL